MVRFVQRIARNRVSARSTWIGVTAAALAFSGVALGQEDATESAEPEAISEEAPAAEEAPAVEDAPAEAAAPATAPEAYYAAGAESKVLPGRVARFSVPLVFANGDSGWNKSGEENVIGLDVSAFVSGLVIEYGVTDSVSLQVGAPWIVRNEMGLDAAKLRQNPLYIDNYNKYMGDAASLLLNQGVCASTANCLTLLESGYALPYDTSIPVSTGERVTAGPNRPVKDYIDSAIINAATPDSGKTGLGDIEVGALYSPNNEILDRWKIPLFLGIGAGFRFPTGEFSDVPQAYRGTGRGTTDLGIRTNVDYRLVDGWFVSWQNMIETTVAPGTKKRSSFIDPKKLNAADPTVGGDGKKNDQEFKRDGFRNVGFVKTAIGFGMFSQELKALGASVNYAYDYDAKEVYDGVVGDRVWTHKVTPSLHIEGLAYRIPLNCYIDYEIPVMGYNASLATTNLKVTLKGFWKF